MERSVLWVDVNCRNLSSLYAKVFSDGHYDIYVASSATEAILELSKKKFDAIIVEPFYLRHGGDPIWDEAWSDEPTQHEFGFEFLRAILYPNLAKTKLQSIPDLSETRIGILTIHARSHIADMMNELGIEFFKDKKVNNNRVLLDFIEEIFAS